MQHALQQTQAEVEAERQEQQLLLQEHAALASMAQYQQAVLQMLEQAGQAEVLPWQQQHQQHWHQQRQRQQYQVLLPPLLPDCAAAGASVPVAEAAISAAAAAEAVPDKAAGDQFCSEGLQGSCSAHTHGSGPGGSGGGSSSAVTPGVFGSLAVYARGERSFVNLILQDAAPCPGAPVGHTWASLRSW